MDQSLVPDKLRQLKKEFDQMSEEGKGMQLRVASLVCNNKSNGESISENEQEAFHFATNIVKRATALSEKTSKLDQQYKQNEQQRKLLMVELRGDCSGKQKISKERLREIQKELQTLTLRKQK